MKNYLILAATLPDYEDAMLTVLKELDLSIADGKYTTTQRRWTNGHVTIFMSMVHSPERIYGYHLHKCYITKLLADLNPQKLQDMLNNVIRPALFMNDGTITWL